MNARLQAVRQASMPEVWEVMSTPAHTIGEDIPVRQAQQLMRDLGVRHLPVRKAGKLVGVLSDRDLKAAAAYAGRGELTVADVMTMDPYQVSPEAPLDEVLDTMIRHKYGSALVMRDGELAGLFTSHDALRQLRGLLKDKYGR